MKLITEMAAIFMLANMLGCATRSQMRETLLKNPDIVFDVISQNPDKFMDVARKASEDAQRIAFDRNIEEDFAHPKVPLIDSSRAARGPVNAPVTIVEYSDFQCPYCRAAEDAVKKADEKYRGKIRFVFKEMPLPMHPQAMPAAQMFEAIALQSPEKAYAFHDELFKRQEELAEKKQSLLDEIAKHSGADLKEAKIDMASDFVKKRIENDSAEAEGFGLTGTPSFLVNGVRIAGVPSDDVLFNIIDRNLAKKTTVADSAPAQIK